MPLYLKDKRIDEIVTQLAAKTKRSKTEIVRTALEKEVANENNGSALYKAVKKLQDDLRKAAGPNAGHKMTKEEIDWLYE